GWPSAEQMGVPEAIAAAVVDPALTGRDEPLLQLLNIWDSRLNSFFSARKTVAFSTLPIEARRRVLLNWADSALAQRRGAFQALRKVIGYLYVMLPGQNGAASPVWPKFGYPGPLGVQKAGAPKPLRVEVVNRDLDLSADVCIVGSGAGGGTAAAVLAAAGKDVIVFEAGGYYDDADFDGAELAGFDRLYLDHGFAATTDHSVGLLAGACVGGGTVVNYCTSFRTPDQIRSEWAAAGIPWFAGDEYTHSLDAVCARLSVNQQHNRLSTREAVFQRGLKSLGWHVEAMPRNVTGCDQGKVCGYCGYGCAIGAKQSTAKTWLLDAQKSGARIYADTFVSRVRIENGKATGVEGRTKNGHRVSVKCKAVVAACGAIHTPALMLRSGLRNAHIGKHLHLHPVSNVCGIFREEIRPWEGTMQAVYSDEHCRMTGNFGVKYETTALQPVIATAVLPWREPRQYRTLLAELPRTMGVGVLLRDRDGGSVTVDRTGWPVVRYALSHFDRNHLRKGFAGAAQILEAAGARRIYSPHARLCSYEPGQRGSFKTFVHDMDRAGWSSGQLALFSFHIMGSARMGNSAKNSVTNPDGECWEAGNLLVLDGSAFPSASGVNPMITIEAIAHRNAAALASRL
ncbi:MAG TPA: GMC family oxidoreductase, partial [Candidatus Dormibacteraeota bacterium]|nr:GMC family oxidoreductase [Candidatus Dormibacteraeota bacterium]